MLSWNNLCIRFNLRCSSQKRIFTDELVPTSFHLPAWLLFACDILEKCRHAPPSTGEHAPDSLSLILGDFNRCRLDKTLRTSQQCRAIHSVVTHWTFVMVILETLTSLWRRHAWAQLTTVQCTWNRLTEQCYWDRKRCERQRKHGVKTQQKHFKVALIAIAGMFLLIPGHYWNKMLMWSRTLSTCVRTWSF